MITLQNPSSPLPLLPQPTGTMEEKKDLLERATMAEQAERYDDMAAAMKTVVEKYPKFGNEERNLLSVAYKNVVGGKRSAWRIMSSIEQKDKDSVLTKTYRGDIAAELNGVCNEVLVRSADSEMGDRRAVSG